MIIQDELHLISDALGSMVGLYETVIDRLCSRGPVRPVLVASTATVRRARDQVAQVFARGLSVFPPPLLDAGETYFSAMVTPSVDSPRRRYRGILAPGERLKSVEIRVAAALLEHAQFLFDRYGAAADPYMTLVDYFTAARELAGMRRLAEDDVADRLSSQQVRTRRRRPRVDELTGRMPSSRIAEQARPSHLITTAGVGATVDLPSMSVIVRGLNAWNPEHQEPIEEPRLLETVQRVLGGQVRALRHAPWDPDAKDDAYTRIGVPVTPFPRWVRCPRCFRLGPLDPSGQFELVHRWGRRPDLARYVHAYTRFRTGPDDRYRLMRARSTARAAPVSSPDRYVGSP